MQGFGVHQSSRGSLYNKTNQLMTEGISIL